MKRQILKIVFWTLTTVFWLLTLFMVLELWERHLSRHDRVFTRGAPIVAIAEQKDLDIFEATHAQAPRPPEEVFRKYPELALLDDATETRLQELAEQWEGIIFHCDANGCIKKRYVASTAFLAQSLESATADASTITSILLDENPDYSRDILFRIERAFEEWRNPQPKLPHMAGCLGPFVDYMIPLPEIPNSGFRFMFHPFRKSNQETPDIYIVVVPWRWKAFYGGFRPDYYESEAYPQFPRSEFWTNSRGFRNEEVDVPKPAGTYRIVCIGGSTTLEGPRNDLTYPKMLQEKLREFFQTDRIEVINCGVDGGGILGQLFGFDEVLDLEPDMVIHYNYVNDASGLIDNVLENTVLKSPWRKKIIGTLAHSKYLTRRCRRFWSAVMPKESDYLQEIERLIMPAMQELYDRSTVSGARFVLASFTCPDIKNIPAEEVAWFRSIFWFRQIIVIQWEDYGLSVEAFNEAARDFCEREGAIYVPVAENLRGGIETFTDHCHLRIPAIEQKADIMFAHLVDIIATDMKVP